MKRSAAVGLGSVGARAAVADAEAAAGEGVDGRAIAGAVVGEDAFDLDAVVAIEGGGAAEEGNDGHGSLVGEDFDAAIYSTSQERTRALDGWLWHYNHRRKHSALGHQPPATPAAVVASERMDEDQAWRKLEPGELVYVDGNGDVHAEVVLKEPPAKPLLLEVPPPPTASRRR